jgi:FtsP/CotA-like multicopper oxidase with cupredoxin domain
MLPASLRVLLVLGLISSGLGAIRSNDLLLVQPNDNRTPAGSLSQDTLRIHLVVKMARWYPESADGPHIDLPVFAEEGKTPSIPGPLIRVQEGTTIVASVRNELGDSTLWVYGLDTRPAKPDSTAIRPGEAHTFTFRTGTPGTYVYSAKAGSVDWNKREREQLSGAFVVDAPGARTDDRILMINIWGEPLDSTTYDNALAINGKSWPNTERFTANIGDSLRWRVINASIRPHPMHLHGFYFRINSRGSWLADTTIAADKRRLEVTEEMRPGATMAITWSPNRPGNWLFHCHFVFHVDEGARLGFRSTPGDVHDNMHDADPMKHMSGLVVGITVSDTAHAFRGDSGRMRKLRLYADERRAAGKLPYHMSYVLERDRKAPAVDSIEPAGRIIVLTQHEPVQVTVVNRTHASTSVHWHGIELESFSDGVPGWSGAMSSVAPMIAPGDSFVARLTVPRAGTFIYHTHLNDIEQLTSGAYGPIVVLEPGKKFDPSIDHVFTLGWLGDAPSAVLLNGDSTPAPVTMRYGKPNRLRFVNIGAAGAFLFGLMKDTTAMTWRPLAKDGADLPVAVQVNGPALRRLTTGETFDAEWIPPAKGLYSLTVRGGGKTWVTQKVEVK